MFAPLLATQPITGHPGLFENLGYQTVGVMVVMTSLGGLAIFVWLIGLLMERITRPQAVAAKGSGAVATLVGGGTELIAPEIRAAIIAAVYSVTGGSARVHEIHPVSPFVQAWSVEGRRQIFQSHSIR